MEANARQYYPAESAPEAARYPESFAVRSGSAGVARLAGPGLGYDPAAIDRPLFRVPAS